MYAADVLTAPLEVTGPVTRDLVFVDDDGLLIGIWECDPGVYDEPTTDYDEMMFMVSGRVTVQHPEGALDIAPGTLWTTPRHWPGVWHVHQTVRKLYVIDPRPGDEGVLSHLANAHLLDLGVSAPRPVVIAGDPRERSVDIATPNRLQVGVWECTPGEFPFARDGYDEVFCVLSGSADLHFDDGRTFELRPGSVILTPAGTTGRWVVHETIRKAYTIVLDRD
ncbi:MAG: cupin domain-containing protein [Ilumatobacteraceae bacterium]